MNSIHYLLCVFLYLTFLLSNLGANFNEGHISHSHFAYVFYKPGLISLKRKKKGHRCSKCSFYNNHTSQ